MLFFVCIITFIIVFWSNEVKEVGIGAEIICNLLDYISRTSILKWNQYYYCSSSMGAAALTF